MPSFSKTSLRFCDNQFSWYSSYLSGYFETLLQILLLALNIGIPSDSFHHFLLSNINPPQAGHWLLSSINIRGWHSRLHFISDLWTRTFNCLFNSTLNQLIPNWTHHFPSEWYGCTPQTQTMLFSIPYSFKFLISTYWAQHHNCLRFSWIFLFAYPSPPTWV
jgi:hypothetical protein